MGVHWTYCELEPGSDLCQGDILRPDDIGLRAVLKDVHPHFCDEKYRAFLVATQSCDLVRRDGKCSARYVNVVVVRALSDLLFQLLDTACDSVADGIYYDDRKLEAKRMLERLFNQNESALGLFYLHPEADAGIVEPCVALLRVGVAFRVEHYETIRKARCGRLAVPFQDKMGWMLGNLYSRVATEDWSEQGGGKKILRKMVEDALKNESTQYEPKWVKRDWVDAARRAGVCVESIPPSDLDATLERHRPATPQEQAIEQVTKAVKEVLPWVCSEEMRRIVARLQNDRTFNASFASQSLR